MSLPFLKARRGASGFTLLAFLFLSAGCAALFGWKIHAPGMLSHDYFEQVKPVPVRMALYLPPETQNFISDNRGSKISDPQTYYIGEAFTPMCLEAFQQGFEEFILMETIPASRLLERYQIPYLVSIEIQEFQNRVTWKGQTVGLLTETSVYDRQMNLIEKFQSTGSSEAQKVFAKKGGPEVNLNAAIENNLKAVVAHLQDSLRMGKWEKK